jgi:hypothetical protein
MIVPHVVMHHSRRSGQKATPRQRRIAVLTSVVAGLISAGVGAAFTKGSRADLTFVLVAIVGLAAVVGLVLARVIGRQGRI